MIIRGSPAIPENHVPSRKKKLQTLQPEKFDVKKKKKKKIGMKRRRKEKTEEAGE